MNLHLLNTSADNDLQTSEHLTDARRNASPDPHLAARDALRDRAIRHPARAARLERLVRRRPGQGHSRERRTLRPRNPACAATVFRNGAEARPAMARLSPTQGRCSSGMHRVGSAAWSDPCPVSHPRRIRTARTAPRLRNPRTLRDEIGLLRDHPAPKRGLQVLLNLSELCGAASGFGIL
jgi:hypothetical protein